MKLGSKLKISAHNLWQNKVRTVLTIIVLLVMATVVMSLASFALNFYQSSNKNVEANLKENGTAFFASKSYKKKNDYKKHSFPQEEVKNIISKLEKTEMFPSIILIGGGTFSDADNLYSKEYYNIMPLYVKSNPLMNSGYTLLEGRLWNASDAGTNNIWIDELVASNKKLGDKISFNTGDTAKEEFTICGILRQTLAYGGVFMDMSHFDFVSEDVYAENNEDQLDEYDKDGKPIYKKLKLWITDVRAPLIKQENITYGIKTISQIRSVSKQLTTNKKELVRIVATDSYSEDQKMTIVMFLVIIGVVLFVSVIIILLSIGCVANTIKITVEQNRKFFGMMKAIGMKNSTVRGIVNWQVAMMTFVGVGAATGIVYGLMQAMKSLITTLMKSVTMLPNPIVVCTVSPIIPIVTYLIFIGFVLLFTRSSLTAFCKKDVISVISEVN